MCVCAFCCCFSVSVLRKEKAGAQVCFLFSEDVWWFGMHVLVLGHTGRNV